MKIYTVKLGKWFMGSQPEATKPLGRPEYLRQKPGGKTLFICFKK